MERRSGPRLVGVDHDGLAWYRSSSCTGNTDEQICLEVALRRDQVFVRCSRLPGVDPIAFPAHSWQVFLVKAKASF